MNELIEWVNYGFLAYFAVLNTSYVLMACFAFYAIRTYRQRLAFFHVEEAVAAASAPPVAVVVPLYNEEVTGVASVRSLLTLEYPHYELLVVNDGSRDTTLERLREAFELQPSTRYPTADLETAPVRGVYRSRIHPNLWVVDKENGGKADAANTGINFCRAPLFCVLDGDGLLDPTALVRIVRPFVEDNTTVAAGGIIRILNGCGVRSGRVRKVRLPGNVLARFQVLEYLRAFLLGRAAWDALGMLFIISGAFGMFKRAVVVEAGGFAPDTIGEDMELVVRLHRHCRARRQPYRIAFIPDPVAWTEGPETLRVLGRQRDRWQRGLMQVLVRHRTMMLNPRYGRIGLVAYPYFFLFEMLGAVVEFVGYVVFFASLALGLLHPLFAIAFFMVAFVWGVALSMTAVALEQLSFSQHERFSDVLRLFGLAVLENFWYRQLNAYWRMRGVVSFLRRVEDWGEMERKGFEEMPAAG